MRKFYQKIKKEDPIVGDILLKELKRQQTTIELIASENFVSENVLRASASILTNKYSEGYPKKRYYGGNEFIDQIEELAIKRAKKLFGAKHVNVQPYSGSPANIEVYSAVLKFGDTILGMALDQGGHLTHGHPVNFSGKAYNFVQYGVNKKTHKIDYEEIRKLAKKHKPKLILSGATAYSRKIDFKKIHKIAKEVGAISMVDMAHISGLVAAKLHPSPFPFTDIVTTTTHKTLRGPRGAIIFCKEEFAKQIDKAVFPGMQGGPHNQTTAAIAIALGEAAKSSFRKYSKQIIKNADCLSKELLKKGIKIISGGTDNHLILVDLTNQNISGKEAEKALEEIGIIVNKNMVPYDKRSPFDPSGIRIGTAAITSRGMKQIEMKIIANLIFQTIQNKDNTTIKQKIKKDVKKICKKFPLYKNEL